MGKRRKRNRKRKEQGVAFPAPLAAVLALAAVVALSYLWVCGRCETVGRSIKGLEAELKEVQKRLINEQYKWSNMKSPRNIETLLKRHGMEMIWPDEAHIVRLQLHEHAAEPGVGRVGSNQYAADRRAAYDGLVR